MASDKRNMMGLHWCNVTRKGNRLVRRENYACPLFVPLA